MVGSSSSATPSVLLFSSRTAWYTPDRGDHEEKAYPAAAVPNISSSTPSLTTVTRGGAACDGQLLFAVDSEAVAAVEAQATAQREAQQKLLDERTAELREALKTMEHLKIVTERGSVDLEAARAELAYVRREREDLLADQRAERSARDRRESIAREEATLRELEREKER